MNEFLTQYYNPYFYGFIPLLITTKLWTYFTDDWNRSNFHASIAVVLALISKYFDNLYLEYLCILFSAGYFIVDIFHMRKYHIYYLVHHIVVIYTILIICVRTNMVEEQTFSKIIMCEMSNPFQNRFATNKTRLNWYLCFFALITVRIFFTTYNVCTINNMEYDHYITSFLFVLGNFYITYNHCLKFKKLKN